VDTPPPPVQPAPQELASVAIHVHQLVSPPTSEQDRWDYHHMPGLTGELRSAFTQQLEQAGYTVVVDRRIPHDVLALIQAEWPVERPGTASLVLTARGETIARFSESIPILGEPPRTEYLEADAAVSLVDAMSRSSELLRFSQRQAAARGALGDDLVIAE
jgi:hypothetical protein